MKTSRGLALFATQVLECLRTYLLLGLALLIETRPGKNLYLELMSQALRAAVGDDFPLQARASDSLQASRAVRQFPTFPQCYSDRGKL